jgi:polyketide biosynthesis enoyl-CoA hydratase PksH
MDVPCVRCSRIGNTAELVINVLGAAATLTAQAISELEAHLDEISKWPDATSVILRSDTDVFCEGMDFSEFTQGVRDSSVPHEMSSRYMALLRRLSTLDKIVIARIEGRATAGGVGIVAASDFVIANRSASFVLPEVIWGLIPCNVIPFLIRRIGFQRAYVMSIMAQPLSAEEAHSSGLIDVLTDDIDSEIRRIQLRIQRIRPSSVADQKDYFRRMWFFDDERESLAVDRLAQILARPAVQEDIKRFALHREFPWQRA